MMFLLLMFIFVFVFIAALINYTNVLVLLMYLELLLLIVNLMVQLISVYSFNSTGILFVTVILCVAACESSIGLALAVSAHKFKANIYL
jgi:NADH:ubiquinone oxidoreductase subunit K